MEQIQNEDFFSISIQRKRNPYHKDSGFDDKILDALHNYRMKEIQRQVAKAKLFNKYYPKNLLTKKDYDKIIVGKLGKYVPDIETKIGEIDKSSLKFNKKLLELYKDKLEPVFVPPPVEPPVDEDPQPAPDGTFWLAEEVFFCPNQITGMFEDNGVQFRGEIFYFGDPTWTGSFGAIRRFGLNPERTPHNPSNNWISAPAVTISEANLKGLTFHRPWDEFGDFWSKCWLNVRQTVFEFRSSGGRKFMRNEKTDSKIQIFLEGSALEEHKFVFETQLMPPVQYHRSRNDTTIGVELEVKFDFQLEGNATLSVYQAEIIMPQWDVKIAQIQ